MIGPIKLFKAVRAVVRVTLDPKNLDDIFVLADLSEESERVHAMLADLKQDPHFARVMRERPRLAPVDLVALSKLPEGTLGHAYAQFMNERGLRHEDLILVEGENDMNFLRNHLRESHDIWHVATGFNTDVAGELGLQAFYAAQLEGPLPVLILAIGMTNTLLRAMDDVDPRMQAITRGWTLGRRADSLFGVAWSDHFDRPLADLRKELGLDVEVIDRELAKLSTPMHALASAA